MGRKPHETPNTTQKAAEQRQQFARRCVRRRIDTVHQTRFHVGPTAAEIRRRKKSSDGALAGFECIFGLDLPSKS